MKVTVDSVLRVARADLTPVQHAALVRALTYPNPEHRQMLRGGRGRLHAIRMASRVPALLCALREDGDMLVLPRACGAILTEIVGRDSVEVEDRRVSAPLPVPLVAAVELRGYQRRAVEGLLRGSGVVHAPTGAGKTALALAAIAAAGECALILVTSRDLANQWAGDVRRILGVEPAMCVGGQVQFAPVTIGMVQTLCDAEHLAAARDRFGVVVHDEAHHAAAATSRVVLAGLPARYRWGVTATPARPDGLDKLIAWDIGPVRAKVTIAELQTAGFLAVPRYVQIATEFSTSLDASERFSDVVTAAAKDPARNTLIADTVARDCRDGAVGLVLTGRVSAVPELVRELTARGLRARGIAGASSVIERVAALSAARAGELDVLVATTIADEGLDVPVLQNLYLTGNAKAEGRFLQRIGRVLRPHPDKGAPVITDFVDVRVGVFAHQARTRKSVFERHFGATAVAA